MFKNNITEIIFLFDKRIYFYTVYKRLVKREAYILAHTILLTSFLEKL